MTYDEATFPALPQSWATVSVAEAHQLVAVKDKVQVKHYSAHGCLAVVDQGAALVGGYTDDQSMAMRADLPVIVFGDHTRALKYVDFPFAAGADGIKVMRPRQFFLPRLFFRFLQTVRLPARGYARHFQYLQASRLAVPPLNEQKRISDKLDAVLARVDACRERLDRVPDILKRLRQSLLAAAASGQLSVGWRQANSSEGTQRPRRVHGLPHGWRMAAVESLIADDGLFADGDWVESKDQDPGGSIRLLQLADVGDGKFLDKSRRFINETTFSALRCEEVFEGDVLVARMPDPLGRACLVPHLSQRCITAVDVAILRPGGNSVSPKWLMHILNQPRVRDEIELSSTGTTRRRIARSKLAKLNLAVPPLDEQRYIAERLDAVLASVDALEARHAACRAQVDRLTPALLAKAFRGELVPQDPNDEHASALLERIRDARSPGSALASQPAIRRTGKTTRRPRRVAHS